MKKPKEPRIAFIVGDSLRILHFGNIPSKFPNSTLVIDQGGGARPAIETPAWDAGKTLRLKRAEMRKLDGRFDVIVCLEPFHGIERIRHTRIAMLQRGYADGAENPAPWHSFADLCLTFGPHATSAIEPFCPCVATGNPRHEKWHDGQFHETARGKFSDRLDAKRKTILHVPAGGNDRSSNRFTEAVGALATDFNVIIKSAGRTQPARQYPPGVIEADDDILELLAVADVMTGDFGEAVPDAVYCGVPVVLQEPRERQVDGNSKPGTADPKLSAACQIAASPSKLPDALRKALESTQRRSNTSSGARDGLFASAETASDAAARAIIALAGKKPDRTPAQLAIRREMKSFYRCRHDLSRMRSIGGIVGLIAERIRKKFHRPPAKKIPGKKAKPPAPAKTKPKPAAASGAVIHIDHDTDLSKLDELLGGNQAAGGIKYVHVSHGADAPEKATLIAVARKNPVSRACLIALCKSGYYPYCTINNRTRFVRSDLVATLWESVKSGEFRMTPDEVVYSLAPPLSGEKPARLLIVMSTIHANPNSSSLHRYFMQNFPKLQKFVPPDTAVLRVGDIGGVLGSFYLNTVHRPENASAIQRLIESVRTDLGVDHSAVVLYGASKGGTGAFYHGLLGGYRCVAVDPIVADEHYVKNLKDFHFTAGGVFPEVKERAFEKLVSAHLAKGEPPAPFAKRAVICSERSPQYPYITRLLIEPLRGEVAFYNSRNPMIKDHPDVAPNTINTTTMLLNQQLYGLNMTPGLTDID